MKRRKIIIDCDPGHDDALAIMWALSVPSFELMAVTTVAGNQTLDKVTDNAIKVLTKLKRVDIPVARGASESLMRGLTVGGEVVHGTSGLEGPILPANGFMESEDDAINLLSKILRSSTEKITIVAIGPLTNIAKLILLYPDLKEKIDEISIMGGGTYGNWTPSAEYNIFADPDAAKIVFNSGIHIIMSGLDVTQKAYITRDETEILRNQGGEQSIFAAELIDFFGKFHYEVEGFSGCTLHDPCAIAVLEHPEIFKLIECNVDVETVGQFTTGMTVVDLLDYKTKVLNVESIKNTTFLKDVNREKFIEYFIAAMRRLDE